MRRNVLIFHSGALGDFVLTWPLAVALGRIFAQSRIVYVAAGQKGELAREVLGVEALDSEGGWHCLFSENAKPPLDAAREDQAAVQKWLEGASHIFSFVAEPGDVWFENVRRIAPAAQVVCLRPRPAEEYRGHVVQYLIDQLADVPMVQRGVEQIASSLSQRAIKAQGGIPSRIVVHPGAGAPGKCWPAEKYLELIARLRQGGAEVRVLFGEVERERWPAEQIAKFENAVNVVWPGSYLELLGELRQAKMFVGNDSGPGHLAGIIGVPTVSIFTTGDANRWQPLGPRVTVLQSSNEEIGVDVVMKVVTGL